MANLIRAIFAGVDRAIRGRRTGSMEPQAQIDWLQGQLHSAAVVEVAGAAVAATNQANEGQSNGTATTSEQLHELADR